jgi:excisionase family DNA binding protein
MRVRSVRVQLDGLSGHVDGATSQVDGTLSVQEAAARLGVSEKTIRRRIKSGALPAFQLPTSQGYEWRVQVDDAAAHLDGAPVHAAGHGQEPGQRRVQVDTPAAQHADPQPIEADYRTSAVVVSPAASAQLTAIMDTWVTPLVDRIAELERDRGRLEAELTEARRWAEIVGMERDQLRAAMGQDARDAARAGTGEAQASDTTTGAGDALGPLRRLWRALRARGGPSAW